MSWQSYIDNLVKTGDIDEAAIVGYQCNAEGIWAATEGYKNITVMPKTHTHTNTHTHTDTHPYQNNGNSNEDVTLPHVRP